MLAEPKIVTAVARPKKEFNVLYVDDETTNLRLFEMAFKRHYNVFIAESGEKAIELMKREEIQLIVTDQKMPRMTGTELLTNTVDEFPDLIRIILTGYADIDSIIQSINTCKLYKYITKPYDQGDMKLTLDKALELFKTRREKHGLIEQLEKINGELEIKVKERTKELEIANQRLTDGLIYAQTIQELLLPKEEELNKVFNDAFVIYRAKDFVGGDFFWFKQITVQGREYSVVAVVDCMGHGVAGALLTMIGEAQLNQIVTDEVEPETDMIVARLDQETKKALAGTNSETCATMDVTLIVVNHQKKQMQFSGARLDLTYFVNGKLERIKGTRKSVGSDWNEKADFQKHIINLSGVTEFYLYSDGFQDQSNTDNKKFGSKKLLELIEQSRNGSMKEQKKVISKTLDDWQRSAEQVDDITLLGISLAKLN